jgi:hypothetical protein
MERCAPEESSVSNPARKTLVALTAAILLGLTAGIQPAEANANAYYCYYRLVAGTGCSGFYTATGCGDKDDYCATPIVVGGCTYTEKNSTCTVMGDCAGWTCN